MMQPVITPIRKHLTKDQVVGLLQDSPALTISGGLEIVDRTLNVVEDISGDLRGGNVERQSYATLHGSCHLQITRKLNWGSSLVRPYMTIGDGQISARFNLGVYYVSTPLRSFAENPSTYDVDGYDILFRLNQKVGDTYAIAAGESYLDKVEDILISQGVVSYLIDPQSRAVVAPTSRVWSVVDNKTWLNVVNDLLASIGYQGVWSDWDGALRCEPYTRPIDRAAEWYYSDDPLKTMLSEERTLEHDFFETPNRWVVWRSNMLDDVAPVEGAGMFTYVNQSTGDTSIDQRDGLVITRTESLDAADQGSLVAQAQQMIDADMQVSTSLNIRVSPNPLHWHFDRMLLADSDALPYADVLCTQWSMPLPPDSDDMTQSWTVLAQ